MSANNQAPPRTFKLRHSLKKEDSYFILYTTLALLHKEGGIPDKSLGIAFWNGLAGKGPREPRTLQKGIPKLL